MTVLSYFDGISCGQLALQRQGIIPDLYFASEIEAKAISCTMENFPNTIQLGDVLDIDIECLPKIDLLIGGSPCQTVSLANKGGGSVTRGKSKLFFKFAYAYKWLRKHNNPNIKFLLENVPMKQDSKDLITNIMGVEPIMINSQSVSIQSRKRLFWSNIPVSEVKDKQLYFKDLHCKQFDEKLKITGRGLNRFTCPKMQKRVRCKSYQDLKLPTIMRSQFSKPTDAIVIEYEQGLYRYPTRREAELMQNLPIGYTDNLRYNDAMACIGNGWTVDVISEYFFKNLK